MRMRRGREPRAEWVGEGGPPDTPKGRRTGFGAKARSAARARANARSPQLPGTPPENLERIALVASACGPKSRGRRGDHQPAPVLHRTKQPSPQRDAAEFPDEPGLPTSPTSSFLMFGGSGVTGPLNASGRSPRTAVPYGPRRPVALLRKPPALPGRRCLAGFLFRCGCSCPRGRLTLVAIFSAGSSQGSSCRTRGLGRASCTCTGGLSG